MRSCSIYISRAFVFWFFLIFPGYAGEECCAIPHPAEMPDISWIETIADRFLAVRYLLSGQQMIFLSQKVKSSETEKSIMFAYLLSSMQVFRQSLQKKCQYHMLELQIFYDSVKLAYLTLSNSIIADAKHLMISPTLTAPCALSFWVCQK